MPKPRRWREVEEALASHPDICAVVGTCWPDHDPERLVHTLVRGSQSSPTDGVACRAYTL